MLRIRDPQHLITQGAMELLQNLEPHLPISLAEIYGRLQAGLLPSQAGDDLGRLLAAYWRPLFEELQSSASDWQNRAESYRLAWEACRNYPINQHLADAKAQVEVLNDQLQEQERQLAAQTQHQRYLKRENERLSTLLDDQQAIIAEQQLQLAQMDESSFDL